MPDAVGSRHAPIFLVFAMLAAAGCVSSQASLCGDLVCPEGRACARGQCVDQAIVTACGRLQEGDACTLPEIGTGTCQAGLCLIGTCGDGVINAIDACDGADFGGKTCLDFGSSDAAGLKCTADCSLDPSGCTAFCGDGTKNSSEQCDGKDFGGKTCISQGFYGGSLACTNTCEINTGSCIGMCGDGVKNGLEQCDGTDFGGTSCETRGFHGTVSPLLCDAACGLDASSCTCGGALCVRNTQKCALVDGIPTCEAFP